MLYAKIVLGLPIDGPFDYLVPADLENKPQGDGLASDSQSHWPAGRGLASDSQNHKISAGMRVWVNFRNKKEVAYVVGLSNKTRIKKLKEVSSLIDAAPVLDEKMLLLTKTLADHYCSSWGEAIETALPDEIRKGKKGDGSIFPSRHARESGHLDSRLPSGKAAGLCGNDNIKIEPSPIIFLQGHNRMPVYLREIKEALAAKKSAIILFSDILAVERAKEIIQKSLSIEAIVAFRKQPKELEIWEKIRQADYCVVVGTRSSIFSPVNNLGLIIIDEEEAQVYKQEQAPHYHAREVARMRADIVGAKVILGSHSPSLESFYLAGKGELQYQYIPQETAYPEVKIIDLRRLSYAQKKTKPIFSKFLVDTLDTVLAEKGRALLLINRKGFATSASCHNCGVALKCPRCNINLVFHFDEKKLKCHHCNFKMDAPSICPSCNAGYIKYAGTGTEKVESELARLFPQARMGVDIFVATGSVIKHQGINFDLIGVLEIDNLLNRVDFRAAEKTFSLLMGLTNLTTKKIIIQAAFAGHHCFQALIKNDPQLFLKEELKQRKQLNFAPFKHMILIKARGADLGKVKKAASDLFERLNKIKTNSIKMLSLNPGQPEKLRGNFYYQVLARASSAEKASDFLKLHLKENHFSGIIVTVDVDPI